jgi:hypothetical protein
LAIDIFAPSSYISVVEKNIPVVVHVFAAATDAGFFSRIHAGASAVFQAHLPD